MHKSARLTHLKGNFMSNTTADVTGIFSLDTNRLVGLAAKGSPDVTYLAGQDTPTSGIPLTVTSDGGNVIGLASGALSIPSAQDGPHVILVAGESHMAGRGTFDATIDAAPVDARIMQYGCYPSDAGSYQKIVAVTDTLYHPEGASTGKIGPATWFARRYLAANPGVPAVILVPMGYGSTSILSLQQPYWSPTNPGAGYTAAITNANAAIAAAQALHQGAKFVGILWQQGSNDAAQYIPGTAYRRELKNLLSGFRAGITSASNAWIVSLGLPARSVAQNAGTYPAITAAIDGVCTELDYALSLPGIDGPMQDSNVHYTAPVSRLSGTIAGASVGAAILAKATATPPVVDTATPQIMRLRYKLLTTESGDAAAGWAYTAPAGASYATHAAGQSYGVLPVDIDGSITFTISVQPSATESILCGVKTNAWNDAWNVATYGVAFGILSDTASDKYRVITSSGTANGDNLVSRLAGDNLRLRRSGSTVIAEVSRAADPTTWLLLKTWTGVTQKHWWAWTAFFGAMAVSKITGIGVIQS